jgi:hypothetical protein
VRSDEEYELAVIVKAATEKAILVETGEGQHWVPRSLLKDGTDVSERGDEGVIVVPGWFAEKENMV